MCSLIIGLLIYIPFLRKKGSGFPLAGFYTLFIYKIREALASDVGTNVWLWLRFVNIREWKSHCSERVVQGRGWLAGLLV